jgi:hypothetical protein
VALDLHFFDGKRPKAHASSARRVDAASRAAGKAPVRLDRLPNGDEMPRNSRHIPE